MFVIAKHILLYNTDYTWITGKTDGPDLIGLNLDKFQEKNAKELK
jgi:hypothetical protein